MRLTRRIGRAARQHAKRLERLARRENEERKHAITLAVTRGRRARSRAPWTGRERALIGELIEASYDFDAPARAGFTFTPTPTRWELATAGTRQMFADAPPPKADEEAA